MFECLIYQLKAWWEQLIAYPSVYFPPQFQSLVTQNTGLPLTTNLEVLRDLMQIANDVSVTAHFCTILHYSVNQMTTHVVYSQNLF